MGADFRLGIQSYTFRTFKTLDSLLDAVSKTGLSSVEIWPGHLPFDLPEAEIRDALARVADAGIAVDGYGAVDFTGDDAHDRAIMSFAGMAGVKTLTVVNMDDASFPYVTRLCDEYDVNIALHNHGHGLRWGTAESLREAFAKTSPRIGLCIDTAWCIDVKEKPLQWIEEFGDRLYGVHLKDFSYDSGERRDVIVGTGGLDLPAFMRKLKELEFGGYLSMEYEGDVDNPLPSAIECVNAIKGVIQAL
ncbi:MAG: TIM barrel protein [Chitinivibrionales bacterium]|nr:TIM barrel protein [Chitinivibrionales bacterium]MBD3394793.1 TIM barrel protein [Chitinivibrionales bacterium]